MAKVIPTAEDLRALTAAELEALQLAVNGEVAVRIQNERLENRLVTALTDAQSVGFTDAEVQAVINKSIERVKKGRVDPSKPERPSPAQPKKVAKPFDGPLPSHAKLRAQHETGDGNG